MSEDSVPPDAKARVAAAVRDALSKHGYARLTTAKIATESENSEAALYYYYDSKDEMIAAFLEVATEGLDERFADLGENPEQRLRAACDRLFVHHEDQRERGVSIAIMELLSHAPHNETIREPLLTYERTTLEFLTAIVEEGVETGRFRELDPRGVAAFLMAAAHGSTGFYLALGMHDAGGRLHDQIPLFVDWLLAG